MGFPGGSDGKEAICSVGDLGLLPGLGRSPGGGHGNPLQCSCLGNPHGQRSLVGCSPWGHKESDMTEHLSTEKYENLLNMRIWEIWEYCWLKEGSAYPTELLLNFYEVGAKHRCVHQEDACLFKNLPLNHCPVSNRFRLSVFLFGMLSSSLMMFESSSNPGFATYCVIVGRLLNLSKLLFPHL